FSFSVIHLPNFARRRIEMADNGWRDEDRRRWDQGTNRFEGDPPAVAIGRPRRRPFHGRTKRWKLGSICSRRLARPAERSWPRGRLFEPLCHAAGIRARPAQPARRHARRGLGRRLQLPLRWRHLRTWLQLRRKNGVLRRRFLLWPHSAGPRRLSRWPRLCRLWRRGSQLYADGRPRLLRPEHVPAELS